MTPPVTFTDKLAAARPQSGIGYPYQIRAEDLDRNFYFATLQLDASVYENTTSGKGYAQRRLRVIGGNTVGDLAVWNGTDWAPISPPSGAGIHVLASNGGPPYWLATEACA